MVSVDDRILEMLSVYGKLRLYQLHEQLLEEGNRDPPVSYVLLRCKRLREYGLLNLTDATFSITDTGSQYLDGELNADLLRSRVDLPDEGRQRHSTEDFDR